MGLGLGRFEAWGFWGLGLRVQEFGVGVKCFDCKGGCPTMSVFLYSGRYYRV